MMPPAGSRAEQLSDATRARMRAVMADPKERERLSASMRAAWARGDFAARKPHAPHKPVERARAKELVRRLGVNATARLLGVHRASIRRWCGPSGRGVYRHDITWEAIHRLRKQGLSWRSIARRLGCSLNCIDHRRGKARRW